MKLDSERSRVFEDAIRVMREFNRVFGRELKPDFVAELYAARELGLELVPGSNAPGHDAIGTDGTRYQVKQRNAQNVDLNSRLGRVGTVSKPLGLRPEPRTER